MTQELIELRQYIKEGRYQDALEIIDELEEMSKKNMAVFEQAMHELALLTRWLGGNPLTALRLPGAGDLFVTVNAGPNSRLGLRLGAGDKVSEALAGPLGGPTVEGVDAGRALGPTLYKAWQRDPVLAAEMPLTRALLNAILHDEPFAFDMGAYWHRDD